MPTDKTFTDRDLIRIYCNNLSDYEQLQVKKWFKKYGGNCTEVPDNDKDKKRIKEDIKTLEGVGDAMDSAIGTLKAWGALIFGYILGSNEEENLQNDIEKQVKSRDEERDVNIIDSSANVAMAKLLEEYDKIGIRLTRRQQARLRQEHREAFRIEMARIDETFKLYPYLSDNMKVKVKEYANQLATINDKFVDIKEVVIHVKDDLNDWVTGLFDL